ncbi:MFS transporter [Agrobacterium leguminum]|uniref:MFS transporter n=1 Tax=Agrobacterium leguminum TaxID=2792015 RepID=UPI001E5667A2|nr:MFS transporter [Agrobacterium leguminum]WFS69401.1 MFS transporter [Agrobacterium leguminum]
MLNQSKTYRYFLFSSFFGALGFYLQMVAQAWLVFSLTHSTSMIGLLAICQFGPLVVFGLFAGPLVDARSPRTILIGSYSLMVASGIVVAVLILSNSMTISVLLLFATLRGFLTCIMAPASRTFVINVVAQEKVPNAFGLSAAADNLAVMIGPAIAGIVISWAGAATCFLLYSASFLGMIWVLYRWKPEDCERLEGRPSFELLKRGLKYVAINPRRRSLFFFLFVVTFIPMSFATTLPILALDTLKRDATVYGILLSSLGVGSLIGSLAVAARRHISVKWAFLAVSGLGVCELLLVSQSIVPVLALIVGAAGCCMTFYVVSIHSVITQETEHHYQGRIGALYNYLVFGVGPLGSSLSGWISERGGTDTAFMLGGIISLLVAVSGLAAFRSDEAGSKTLSDRL